jgi:hypothetical protein
MNANINGGSQIETTEMSVTDEVEIKYMVGSMDGWMLEWLGGLM